MEPSATHAVSKNGVRIRLPVERWLHIETGHPEFAGERDLILDTIRNPIRIFFGGKGELIAVREWRAGMYAVVVYREMEEDGFVLTAYPTKRLSTLDRRQQAWPLQ